MFKLAVVVHEGDKWLVKTEDKSRTLGTHDTAKDAYAQLYAIEKSKERQKKESSMKFNSGKKQAIANEQEFNKAMGGGDPMGRVFMDIYAEKYDQHRNAIDKLRNKIINSVDPVKKEVLRDAINKHDHASLLINNIMGKHMDALTEADHSKIGDLEDHYHAVAKDAFQHSGMID